MVQVLRQLLTQSVGVRASAAAGTWLKNRLLALEAPSLQKGAAELPGTTREASLAESTRGPAFEIAFAGAGRRFGYVLTQLDASELAAIAECWTRASVASEGYVSWSGAELSLLLQDQPLATLVRVALLSAWVEQTNPEARCSVVNHVFHTGDAQERAAVLRALPLLPNPEQFLELGIEACRTHIQGVFEAIACENPYAARYFPEPAFNQMVIKCLFTEVQLVRVSGLPQRRNAELRRMATDYESERRAAGRAVPQDIETAKALT